MPVKFRPNNEESTILNFLYSLKYRLFAYEENNGLGSKAIKNLNFVERTRYGHVDHENNSIIPNENFIVNTSDGRVFDFVADSYALMKLNCLAALNKGLLPQDNQLVNLRMVTSYTNPKLEYGEYLSDILQDYNETQIPIIGKNSITSFEGYVNNFFKFFLNSDSSYPLTFTAWNTSNLSNPTQTGLCFSLSEIPFNHDNRKVDEIIKNDYFDYFQNLCMNMGFSIVHNSPNLLMYDVRSPANKPILGKYSLYNLTSFFKQRFIKTYTLDNDILYNKITLYYNKYVERNSLNRVVSVECKSTVSEYFRLSPVPIGERIYSDNQQLELYIKIRNKEEGSPFSQQKIRSICNKAKYLNKKLDKPSAMSYINDMFKDQIWNKDDGFHDLRAKLQGKTQTEGQREQTGGSRSPGLSSY